MKTHGFLLLGVVGGGSLNFLGYYNHLRPICDVLAKKSERRFSRGFQAIWMGMEIDSGANSEVIFGWKFKKN